MERFNSLAAFWPYYLREHARPQTRALHYLGTTLVVLIAIAALVTERWAWLIVMPVAGYAFAWIGHYAVERNRPPPSPIRFGPSLQTFACGAFG